jgi:hypothetical protein
MNIHDLQKQVDSNTKNISHNKDRIDKHYEMISHNTGALEILRGFKTVCKVLFVIWLLTFIALLYFIFN